MFIPNVFSQKNPEALYHLMQDNCLGALTCLTDTGLNTEHIPFLIPSDITPGAILQTHVSRRNPVWEKLDNTKEAMVIFQGQNHYISPSWYPGSKTHGKVAPSWNYMVVHAYGMIKVIEDGNWIARHFENLTEQLEENRDIPWRVNDLPEGYGAHLSKAVVGLEITETRFIGKWQTSQHRSIPDRLGVIEGLKAEGTPSALSIAKVIESALPEG